MRTLSKDNRITISSPGAKACLIASFFLPVLILLFAAWRLRLAPFTDKYYMPLSMQETYLPVISELCHKVKNGESVFYTWNSGGGTSFWTILACYAASPFTLLYLCFSEADIPKITQVIFALRCAFASLSFCVLLWKKEKLLSPLSVAFSTAYGLSAYFLTFYEEPWFLDTLIYLPLLILGAYYLLQGRHNWLFIFSLALIIISSWQAGLYVLVFAIVLIPMLAMEANKKNPGIRKILTNVKDFAIAILLSAGISAFSWFPVLQGILNSSLADLQFRFPQDLNTNMKIWDLLERFSFDSYPYSVTESTQFPAVYCGIFAVMLVLFYALTTKIPFKEKLYSFSALFFFYVIMANRFLSFLFSGFHYPLSSTYPQAFLLVFLIMYLGGRALACGAYFEKHRNLQIVVAFLIAFLVINSAINSQVNYSDHRIYYAISFIVLYFAVICLLEKNNTRSQNRFLAIAFSVLLLSETALAVYHPLKDRYFVKSMKERITDPALNYMTEDQRKTLLPNQKSEWVYELSSAVTYHEPDELMTEEVEKEKQNLQEGERLGFYSGNSANYGLLYHVPTLNSSFYIQSASYASTLKALGLSRSGESIELIRNVPWMQRLFAVSGSIGTDDAAGTGERGSLGYFSSSEQIYEPLTGAGDPFSKQNLFTSLFSEGAVLDEIPYSSFSVDELKNMKDLKDGRFSVVSSKEMSEADIMINIDYIKPIYIQCNCDQQVIMEVTQCDEEGKYLDMQRSTSAQNGVLVQETMEETKQIKIHMEFPENKAETFFLAVASYQSENYEKLSGMLSRYGFRITSFSSDAVEGDITAPESGNLIFTVPYDKGWTVLVDGQETGTFAACDAFLAIHLTEGEHHVTMKYKPAGWKIGMVSLAAFAFLAIFLSVSKVHTGKKKNKEGQTADVERTPDTERTSDE